MGNEVFAWLFFSSALLCQQPFSTAIDGERERERTKEKAWNDKMRIQSVAKIRLTLPKPIRMKSAKFVFVHKCVELYISMRLLPSIPHSFPLSLPLPTYYIKKKNICYFISASSSWMASFVLCNTFNLLCCWPIFMAWHSLSHQIYKSKT